MHMDGFLPFLPFVMMLLAAVAIAGRRRRTGSFSYRQCDILTQNEAEFFGRLRAALPDHYVFPQVAMRAIVAPQAYARSKAGSF